MGNQQAKPNFEIGWLVGIIDGEGWIMLAKAVNHPSGNIRYIPTIGVNATDKSMIDEMSRILDKHQVGHWIGKKEAQKKKWKDQWQLIIRGFKRSRKMLDLLGDSLIVKQDRADVLRKFIQFRSKLNNHDAYGEKEKQFFQELKRLNRRGKAPTTKG